MLRTILPEDDFTADAVSIQEYTNSKITRKIYEKWVGDYWMVAVMTEKRVVDGYYVITGYFPQFDTGTYNVGEIRIDYGKLYNDDDRLYEIAQNSVGKVINYPYNLGTSVFPYDN